MEPPKISTTLGAAQAAVRAASNVRDVRVFLPGVPIEAWAVDDIMELLADAQADGEIYWAEPPPDLGGYDLACQDGDGTYRIQVGVPAGVGL